MYLIIGRRNSHVKARIRGFGARAAEEEESEKEVSRRLVTASATTVGVARSVLTLVVSWRERFTVKREPDQPVTSS